MKLTFHTIDQGILEFDVPRRKVIVGRGSECDVIIKIDGISRNHCLIEQKSNGEFHITDLGSLNGVLVDGQRIPAQKPIQYTNYLSLTIGPIPHVHLEPGLIIDPESKEMLIGEQTGNFNIELETSGRDVAKARAAKKHAAFKNAKLEVEKQPPWKLILLALVFIAVMTYVFFDH